MIYRMHRLWRSVTGGFSTTGHILHKGLRAMTNRSVAAVLCGVIALSIYARYVTDVNIFVIKDDNRVTVHESFTRNPQEALEEAGIHISKYDYVSLADSPTIGRANEIQIIRANTVNVTMDGSTQTVITLETTVADALEKAGYQPRERDILSHQLDEKLQNDMEISVTRIDIVKRTATETIPYQEIRRDNTSMALGKELVTTEGETGQKKTLYTDTYRDGVLVSAEIEKEEVIKPAQDRVVEVGSYTPKPVSQPKKDDPTTPRPNLTTKAPKLKDLKYSKVLEVTCTAYTTENRKWKWNYMGKVARVGTIAVDPKVIPLGSKVYIQSTNGTWIYGVATCEDTGGSIKGNKIDLFFNTRSECFQFGVRKAFVYILE